jgi:hypothetical protein
LSIYGPKSNGCTLLHKANGKGAKEGFFYLKRFSEKEGHCRVVKGYKTDDGYRLGSWIRNQRNNKDAMQPDRRQRLEALPGWSWDVPSERWEVGFSHLKQFSKREGHCRVPHRFKTSDDYRLGIWVSNQRNKKDAMQPDRRQRLEALPGWVWNANHTSLETDSGSLQNNDSIPTTTLSPGSLTD